MAKTVTIIIEPDGEFKIDLNGFHGQGCAKAMADFAGGEKPILERNKPEFREVEKQEVKNRA